MAGPQPGQQLDLDWDALASQDFTQAESDRLIAQFLSLPFPDLPATSFLIYSPDYSIDDRTAFQSFANTLAAKLGADLMELPAPLAVAPIAAHSIKQRIKQFMPPQLRAAKRGVAAQFRTFETRNDLPIRS